MITVLLFTVFLWAGFRLKRIEGQMRIIILIFTCMICLPAAAKEDPPLSSCDLICDEKENEATRFLNTFIGTWEVEVEFYTPKMGNIPAHWANFGPSSTSFLPIMSGSGIREEGIYKMPTGIMQVAGLITFNLTSYNYQLASYDSMGKRMRYCVGKLEEKTIIFQNITDEIYPCGHYKFIDKNTIEVSFDILDSETKTTKPSARIHYRRIH